jgi:hypothetical protein
VEGADKEVAGSVCALVCCRGWWVGGLHASWHDWHEGTIMSGWHASSGCRVSRQQLGAIGFMEQTWHREWLGSALGPPPDGCQMDLVGVVVVVGMEEVWGAAGGRD